MVLESSHVTIVESLFHQFGALRLNLLAVALPVIIYSRVDNTDNCFLNWKAYGFAYSYYVLGTVYAVVILCKMEKSVQELVTLRADQKPCI